MQKEVFVYRLTDFHGEQDIAIVEDGSARCNLGGHGSDGQYHCTGGEELWHCYEWAKSFGMKLECGKMKIEIPESIFTEGGQ